MSLVLSAATAEKLAARYLPAGTVLSADMIADVAGEFANVIAGQAKTSLKGTPYHFNLSTPMISRTVFIRRGQKHREVIERYSLIPSWGGCSCKLI